MSEINIPAVVIVSLLAIAFIIFIIIRNKKDKNKHLPPSSTGDAVDRIKSDHDRRKDTI
jgi:hypothetical protein